MALYGKRTDKFLKEYITLKWVGYEGDNTNLEQVLEYEDIAELIEADLKEKYGI